MERTVSKKLRITVALFLVLIILTGALFVKLNEKAENWQRRSGEYNYSLWHNIGQMAWMIDKDGVTAETLKTYRLYINAVVHGNSGGLVPPFNGSGKAHAFLGTYYDSFAVTLTDGSLNADQTALGLALFEEMNKELMAVCDFVDQKVGNSAEKRGELADYNSKLCQEVELKVKDFCNRYADKISQFNYQSGVTFYTENIDTEFKGEGISVLVQHIKYYVNSTVVDCIVKTDETEIPLNHITTHIKGKNGEYKYIEASAEAKEGQAQYSLYFEPLKNEKEVGLFIELKSGKSINIPLVLERGQ
ncbi:MAG: hypothetical protein IKD04_09075 [Clostridia bacterium]|nr:hypothetical protein [Clostridia bacterium]